MACFIGSIDLVSLFENNWSCRDVDTVWRSTIISSRKTDLFKIFFTSFNTLGHLFCLRLYFCCELVMRIVVFPCCECVLNRTEVFLNGTVSSNCVFLLWLVSLNVDVLRGGLLCISAGSLGEEKDCCAPITYNQDDCCRIYVELVCSIFLLRACWVFSLRGRDYVN